MRAYLSGGGGPNGCHKAYEMFAEDVKKAGGPIGVITFARSGADKIKAWLDVASWFARFGITRTVHITDGRKLEKELSRCGGVFVVGGNTYRLLRQLKESGAFEPLARYLDGGGNYMGSSAGCIIGGYDIDSIYYMDQNHDDYQDLRGLDLVGGYSFGAHFTTSPDPAVVNMHRRALVAFSKTGRPVYAPSELTTVLALGGGKFEIIGDPLYVFENGVERTMAATIV